MKVNETIEAWSVKHFWLALFLISLFSFGLRIIYIDLRPLHNDEGVNFHFLQSMTNLGYYDYSHENYHGPSYFYLTKFFIKVFGDNEYGLRISNVILGVITPLLLVALIGIIPNSLILLWALLVALSPSLTFYSRYAIHEPLFLFAGVGFAIWCFKFLEKPSKSSLYITVIFLALMIATKETFIIQGFAVFMGLVSILNKDRFKKLLVSLKSDEIFQSLGKATLIFGILLILFYTGGFQSLKGIRELFLSVPQWVGRGHGDYGHFKPFFYYAEIFLKTETYIVISVILFMLGSVLFPRSILAARDSTNGRFMIFLFIWGLCNFLVYSYVKYKTPWLIMNITFPLVGIASFFVINVASYNKILTFLLILVAGGSAVTGTYWYNFARPYGTENPFSYVHTSSGMMELVIDINEYWRKNPEGKILIAVPQYWPLPYYLRSKPKQIGYIVTNNPENYTNEYDIIIVDKDNAWRDLDWDFKYYRLSDVQESFTYFRNLKSTS